MNIKRFVFSIIAAFIFVFAFDFLVHGKLLSGIYEETAHLWRPMGEHENYMHFMFISQLLFAGMLAFIFTRNYEGKGISEGIRYGLMMGVLIGALQIGKYCYMPVPPILIIAWTVSSIVQGVGVGIVLALVYRK